MRRLLLLVLCAAALAGCAAPAPTTVAGMPARLDPAVAPYDTVEFQTDRQLPFTGDQVCTLLKSNVPFDKSSGCSFDLPNGAYGTFTLAVNQFRIYRLGGVSSFYRGFAHSRRGVLLGRYHSMELVDEAYLSRPCTVVVDVGGPQALTVTASPSQRATDRLRGEDSLPLPDAVALCAVATRAAEDLLTTVDPDGGSVTG